VYSNKAFKKELESKTQSIKKDINV